MVVLQSMMQEIRKGYSGQDRKFEFSFQVMGYPSDRETDVRRMICFIMSLKAECLSRKSSLENMWVVFRLKSQGVRWDHGLRPWGLMANKSKIKDLSGVQDVFRVKGLFQPLKHFYLVGVDVHREEGLPENADPVFSRDLTSEVDGFLVKVFLSRVDEPLPFLFGQLALEKEDVNVSVACMAKGHRFDSIPL